MQSQNSKARFSKALTLLEMVMALAIITIIFAAILPQFMVIQNNWGSQAGAAETLHFLRNTPELRIPGKGKKLKGKLRGLLQYNVNYSDRVQYWVDKERGIVWVEYAGPHP